MVGAGVLMHQHAGQGRAFAFDAVFAPAPTGFDHHGALQHALEPAVAAHALRLGDVLAVEVRHVPARKAALVQADSLIAFGCAGAALGDLAQSPVQQAIQAVGLVALDVAAKAALALPEQHGRLGLAEPSLAPAVKHFLKSHLPVLLH